MSRVALFLLVLAGLLGRAATVRAEDPAKTVVILVDPSVLPIARRLTLEIESLGLTVEQLSTDSPRASFLKDQALAAGAVAAIQLAPLSGGGGDVDMTILDGATGHTVTWKVAAASPTEPAPLDLIATRTVELLRVSLLDQAARRAARAEVQAAARVQRAHQTTERLAEQAKDPEERFSISVGPGLIYSAHLRPGTLLQSSAVWLPTQRFGVAFTALVPMGAARMENAEGSIDLLTTSYRVGPVVRVGVDSPVSLRVTTGLELDWLRFDGSAYAPHHGATVSRDAWAPFAAATTRFRVTRGWYVFTELAVALPFPTTVVRVADREVANWGRPLGTAAFGVELAWPSGAAR